MEQKVIYNGQILTLTRFWATGEPCLWITDPQQIGMPKMEFVGGHPDEYCISPEALMEECLHDVEQAAYHSYKALNQAIAQHLMQGDLQENLDRL